MSALNYVYLKASIEPFLRINIDFTSSTPFIFHREHILNRAKVEMIFNKSETPCENSNVTFYSRTPLIRPPSESHWCGRIRGMVARGGFVYKQNVGMVVGEGGRSSGVLLYK